MVPYVICWIFVGLFFDVTIRSIFKKNSKIVCTFGHIASEWLSLLHNFCGSVGLAALVFDAPFDISTRSRWISAGHLPSLAYPCTLLVFLNYILLSLFDRLVQWFFFRRCVLFYFVNLIWKIFIEFKPKKNLVQKN